MTTTARQERKQPPPPAAMRGRCRTGLRSWSRWGGLLIPLASLLIPAAPVAAQEYSVFDRAEFRLGGYVLKGESSLRADGSRGSVGTRLDLERILGLDESDAVLDVEATFHLGRRHQLVFGYFEVSRDGVRVIDREIRFGEQIFAVGGSIDSSFDMQVITFSYTFFPIAKERVAFGIGLGTEYLALDARLSGQAVVTGGGGGMQVARSERRSADLPIPLLRTDFRYAFLPRLLLVSHLAYLDVNSFEGWSGTALDLSVALEHKTFEHAGFGVTYRALDLDGQTEVEQLRGQIEVRLEGFELYLRLSI